MRIKIASLAIMVVFCFLPSSGRAGNPMENHPDASALSDEAITTPDDTSTSADKDRPFGIERRVAWTSSRVTGSPEPPAPYLTERAFGKLSFKQPVELTGLPGSDRLVLVELSGKIYTFRDDPAVETTELAIDLSQHIEGMKQVYGLTFHPEFRKNRFCYIVYVLESDLPTGTHVSRFQVTSTDPPQIDPQSEKVLITWRSGGHNGSCLKFGPDGYLYISSGDAGPAFPPDPRNTGQGVDDLLSCVLRIDVDQTDGDRAYRIPDDNPFVGHPGARGEIWAYGFRNPWRMCFDPVGGDLWVGDVGWELWEMICRVQKGGNYGWSLVEGRQPVHRERERGPTPILPPTVEHSHIESRSITGGEFYYGDRLPDLAGAYIYGDYVTGKIWALRPEGDQIIWKRELVDSSLAIVSFGHSNSGELYIVDYGGGINRLVPNPRRDVNQQFPKWLSETGLFSSVNDHRPAAGVIGYSIVAEPWADGATVQRFIALPGQSVLGVHTDDNAQVGNLRGEWKYPSDSVLMKTISLESESGNPASSRRIETQLLHYDVDTWRGYTYVWNDDQTDAVLADANGLTREFTITDPQASDGLRTQSWHFASRAQCLLCHTTRGGSIYGFTPNQLDKNHRYSHVVGNQLRTLHHIGLFSTISPDRSAGLVDPHDESVDINRRARSYLQVNCAHCHLRGGGGAAAFDVRLKNSLEETNLLASRPTQGTFGIHSAQVIAPGEPFRSVLWYRMAKLGPGRMPHLGSSVVDVRGLKLMQDWIAQLPRPTADHSADNNAGEPTSSDGPDESTDSDSAKLVASLSNAGPDAAAATVAHLLSTTSGALRLISLIDRKELTKPMAALVIAKGAAQTDPRIRDLFERFVPASQRTQRLGSVVDTEAILLLAGDRNRGSDLFFNGAGVSCKNCHKIHGRGNELGPELSTIGRKQTRAQLLQSILEPSKNIDPKFVSYVLETTSGRVHSGLLAEKTPERVVLKDATNRTIEIAADEVELLAPQQKSLMPELLLREMTPAQVADLLEFLQSLK